MSNKPRFSPYVQMVLATMLFACMGVCVKLASVHFSTATVVAARGLIGAVMMAVIAHASRTSLRTSVPALHIKRGLAGVAALALWFYCMGRLPLATAVTLNYMSSVWMAVFLVLRAWLAGGRRVDPRLLTAVAVGFVGVGLVLHPTIARDQIGVGLLGVASGMLAALAYLQVSALGRVGEPEVRVVFYFSLMGTLLGALIWLVSGAWQASAASGGVPALAWLALIGVGAFATLAQLLMTRAYATGRALVNANLQYLGIVHAALFGMLFFDESIGLDGVLGMALIVAAGMAATRFPAPPLTSSSEVAHD